MDRNDTRRIDGDVDPLDPTLDRNAMDRPMDRREAVEDDNESGAEALGAGGGALAGAPVGAAPLLPARGA